MAFASKDEILSTVEGSPWFYLPPEECAPQVRKHLSAMPCTNFCGVVREDPRPSRAKCPFPCGCPDVGLAMFSLKDPSLLPLRSAATTRTAESVFASPFPSDTHMREILDPWNRAVAALVRRGLSPTPAWQALEPFVFHQGCYLLSLDGTGYFSSSSLTATPVWKR